MVDNRGHSAINLNSWWSVEKYDTGASAWVDANPFPAPGIESINENRTGNAQMVLMADGSLGRVVPDVRSNRDTIRMVFSKVTTTTNLLTELNTYMDDNTGIRITTHTGDKFEGYLDNVNKLWDLRPGGPGKQEFTVEVLMQPFDVDGSGAIND